ncbi:uncharacterized protein LOC105209954 isoform X2 [Zeugodacus cucurbitae]|uniref:Uncharacterized protein n=2 Tax=Zeugodacus cucurbitae TaxID=28588 RepID=A0A0A1XTK5_ZEUCU|nr:uncharacterized protein LOC105209954 isoform X2 [Zeugodacus cucurbitae]
MTFYWWSHWFWITTLSTILLSITFVHTYPSQEISLEYNQNSKSVKAVTKLQQTTTSLEWTTTTPATPLVALNKDTRADAVVEPILQEKLKDKAGSADEELVSEDLDKKQVQAADSELADTAVEQENIVENEDKPTAEEGEYKRSAENYNKTIEDTKALANEDSVEEPQVAAVVAEQRSASVEESRQKLNHADEELSNYTNSSRKRDETRFNATCANCNTAAHQPNSTTAATRTLEAPKTPSQQPANNTSATAAHAKSRIDSLHSETLEWLNAMAVAAALPVPKLLTNAPQATEIDREVVTVPTESATVGAATTQQRIPFTLENANKEDELRRAENEHRSRKSKVLSAEYKHINRYINYSSDSKSLLTRSASTTPNDFGGIEEGNISSEALSIQRTYFLDAGAISAICFTIFGVCCTVGTIGIVLYRRRYVNKPQALSEPDSSVYIDDSTMRVSDNSDEMYSLDNDSFLNSLEAMTIQNYWTDTVKHTKL